MAIIIGVLAIIATLLGGLFALRKEDKLHLILGFSAGAVIGVAFFDLLPEAIELGSLRYETSVITGVVAIGFLAFMLLSRFIAVHPHNHEDEGDGPEGHFGSVGAASLALHSFLDGVGVGLAFQVSTEVGLVVAAAVLAHDFSDGINTVSMVLKHDGGKVRAFRWLIVDSVAPFLGILSASFFSLSEPQLGLVLALFCGFFLFIGASDLLPESHHRHPKLVTSLMTIVGAGVIYFAIQFAHF